MKKVLLALLSLVFVSCVAFAMPLGASANETQNTEIFTETKCQISNDGDRMLIVTGIKSVNLIYGLGYEINGEYTAKDGDIAETNKYYQSLTLGATTKTASEFIDGAEGLLIWEIAYDNSIEYTIKPYALVGEINDGGQLVAPETETKTYGEEKANFNAFEVTFELNGEEYSSTTANYGEKITAPQVDVEDGYTFDGWYLGEDKYDFDKAVKGSLTLTATYTANTDTAYTVNIYKEKLMGGGYDLVQEISGKGTTDTTVSIDDVEMPAIPEGFVLKASSVTEGTIKGDGTTELSVYWDYQNPTAVNNWTTWYNPATATMGTNTNQGQYAGAVQFITNSNKVYLAGQFVYETFGFQGFVISSGDTYRFFALRATGFNVWKVDYTATNHNVVCDTGGNSSYNIADKREGVNYPTEVLNTAIIGAIAGNNATNKQPNAQLTIVDDIMQVWYEGELCLKINLTQYGFTTDSNYNVGFMKPNHNGLNAGFTVNSIEVRTGSVVDEIVTELTK